MPSNSTPFSLIPFALVAVVACSNGAGNGSGDTGGSPATSSGGAIASGGSSAGGALGNGGSVESGGSLSAGGTFTSGGGGASNTSGGSPSTTGGGANVTGGKPSTGGAFSGGSAGKGGAPSTAGTGGKGNSGGRANGGAGGSGLGGASSSGGGGAGASKGGATGAAGSAGAGGGAFMPCPMTGSTACVVLPLGDSITEGCCSELGGGYRIELFRQAVLNQKSLTFVGSGMNGPDMVEGRAFPKMHEGNGGYTIAGKSDGIAGSITNSALTTYKPHIVLLMIGTNDISRSVDVANAPNRLDSLMNDIVTRAPSALLVVSAIVPTTNDGTNQNVRTFNTAVKDLVSQRAAAGQHVVFVDNYAAFVSNPNFKDDLMYDSLHPSDAGYVVLGKSFYGVIGPLLPAGQ